MSLKSKMEAKNQEIEKRFLQVKNSRRELADQRAELDRQINLHDTELVRLQGESKSIMELLDSEAKEEKEREAKKDEKKEPQKTIPTNKK